MVKIEIEQLFEVDTDFEWEFDERPYRGQIKVGGIVIFSGPYEYDEEDAKNSVTTEFAERMKNLINNDKVATPYMGDET